MLARHCNRTAEECQSKDPVPINLEVVSLQPRVFIIPNFLSEFEVEEIIRIAIPLQGGSQVGNADGGGVRKSDTRTSKNSWIKRSTSPVIESIARRSADLLQLDEKVLTNKNTEDLQVFIYYLGF